MQIKFEGFSLDLEQFELLHDGKPVATEPLVFNLIALLAGHPNRLFNKDELIEQLWSGKVISDSAVSSAIKSARKALGDDGEQQRLIQTVRGRGFRFSGITTQIGKTQQSPKPEDRPNPEHSDKNESLIVMPMQSFSAENEETSIVQALPLAIQHVIKRIPLLDISGESSRFTHLPIAPTPRQIYDELDVNYLVNSNARYEQDALHISVQLVDTQSGFIKWSDHFAFSNLQDTSVTVMALAICAKLQPQINHAILEKVNTTEGEQSAKSLFLKAVNMVNLRGYHEATFKEAADLLRQSHELDENLPHAPAFLSLILAFSYRIGMPDNREANKNEAIKMAEHALEQEDFDTTVLGYCGCALADVGMIERGTMLLHKAIQTNDTNPQAWVALGAAKILEGDLPQSVQYLERGIAISPLDGCLSVWRSIYALSLLMTNNPKQAEAEANIACQHSEKTHLPWIVLSAARLLQRNTKGALRAAKEAFRIRPELEDSEIEQLVGPKLGSQIVRFKGRNRNG